MVEIELEKTYLAKYLPADLKKSLSKEVKDIYIPASAVHPVLRIRKNGDKYVITKKEPASADDASVHNEHTIKLTEDEFKSLEKVVGKKVSKIRYFYKIGELTAEVDVFKDDLEGLVLVDVEFKNVEQKDAFEMPEFCLAEVTQEEIFAGGMLAGKKYADLEKTLKKYKYKRISR
jgi:CYTH domain-containing protein